jgi:ABC-type glycerol-3-phosphate transport system substrate-binding protein
MSEKQRISRRDFLRAATVTGLGLVAAQCVAPAPPPAAPTEAPKAAEAPEPTAAAPGPEAVTLSVAHWWGDLWMDSGGKVLEEKLNVKIDSQSIPVQEYADKVLTQLAGGVATDIIQQDATWKGPFLTGEVFEPLDAALAAANIDMSKWWVDPKQEVGYKGQIMGLEQFAMQANIVHVNKEITDAAGVKLPEWGTPEFDTWTWDKFVEFLNAVTKRDAQGNIEVFGVDLNYTDFMGVIDYNIFQFGGQTLDDGVWNFEEQECLVNSPEVVAGFQAIVDLVLKHKVAPSIEGRAAIEGGAYRAGKAACTFFWSTSQYYGDLEFEQTYLHFPWAARRSHPIGGNSLYVNKASKNKEKAIEAVIFHTTDWDDRQVFTEVMGTPSAYETLDHAKTMPEGPGKVTTQIGLSRVAGMSECDYCTENVYMWPRWKGRHGVFIEDTLMSALQAGLVGEDVQKVLDDAKAKIDTELKTG